MMRSVAILVIVSVIFSSCKWKKQKEDCCNHRREQYVEQAKTAVRPRVIIFSSIGGGGHTSAAQAIMSYVGDRYDISLVHIFSEVLGGLDPFRVLSYGTLSGEGIYNFFLTKGLLWGGGMWCSMGKLMSSLCRGSLEVAIETFLREHRPDMIVSVVPVINGVLYNVAARLDIPFGVITVDLDTVNYVNGIYAPTFKKFFYTIPFKDEKIEQVICPAKIPESQVRIVGFPVRTGFLQKYNKKEMREALCLPLDKQVIFVIMGAAGSQVTIAYARALRRVKRPMHLVFCTGRNESLKRTLEKMVFPSHVSTTVLGFSNKIPEFMAASDLVITKPGPTTICEALALQVPMLLDHTGGLIYWERLNIEFVLRNNFGAEVCSLRRLPRLVESFLGDEGVRSAISAAMERYLWPDVRTNICSLFEEMLTNSEHTGFIE